MARDQASQNSSFPSSLRTKMEKAAEKARVDINRMPPDFWAKGERILAAAEGPKIVEKAWEACLEQKPDKARFFFDEDGKDFSKWARVVNGKAITQMKAAGHDEPFHPSVLAIIAKAVLERLSDEQMTEEHAEARRVSTGKPYSLLEEQWSESYRFSRPAPHSM